MDQNEFQKKIAAATELGLEIVESFTKVDNDYFQRWEIKSGREIIENHTFLIDKVLLIERLESVRDKLTTDASEMQSRIDQIQALDQDPPVEP